MGIFDQALLMATVTFAVPLLLAGTGELVAQRTGVLNIGLEGMMLVGAFSSFLVASSTGSLLLGILGGLLAGMLAAGVVSVMAISARGDQIIVGIGINVLALGLTTFLNQQIFGGERAEVEPMTPAPVPALSDIPLIGRPLFDQVPLAYAAFLLVPAVWLVITRTRAGLLIRATGESPSTVDVSGGNVTLIRWLGTLFAGALAGLGGSMLTLGSVGVFISGMSAGQGFIALASVIVGRWHPAGVLGACLLFGGATALQLRLQTAGTVPPEVWLFLAVLTGCVLAWMWLRHGSGPRIGAQVIGYAIVALGLVLYFARPEIDLPAQLWLMLPYVMTLVVLASLGGLARMPSALTMPYQRSKAV